MIKNGFISENIVIEYEDDKLYKASFYNKGNNFVNITSSDNIQIVNSFKFKPSNLKQNVSFKLIGDIKKPLYLIFNSNGKYTKLNINLKENNTFILNKFFIREGDNYYTIEKKSNFLDPKLILITNKGSRKLKYTQDVKNIYFKINAVENLNYQIRIKDGLKTKKFKLKWYSKEKTKSDFKYDLKISYQNGRIYILLKSLNDTLKSDLLLNVNGDLKEDFIWKKGEKEKTLSFPHQILKWENFSFNINGEFYNKTIINKKYFPTKIAKTKNGIRFEKPTPEELVLNIGDINYIVPAKVINYDINWEGKKMFKLYFKNVLLVRQKLKKEKYLPELYILNNPLRLKISHRYYDDVKVTFSDNDMKYVIPSGQTETLISHKNSGMRHLNINAVENAIPKMKTWKIFLK